MIAIETIRPLITIGCASAPSPEFSLIVGVEVYPDPADDSVTAAIGPRTCAVARAPTPPPPVIDIIGSVVYPLPPLVTFIAVTDPFTETVAAAGVPSYSQVI